MLELSLINEVQEILLIDQDNQKFFIHKALNAHLETIFRIRQKDKQLYFQ